MIVSSRRSLLVATCAAALLMFSCGAPPSEPQSPMPPPPSGTPLERLVQLVPQLGTEEEAEAGREVLQILLSYRRTGWALELARRLTADFPNERELWQLRAATAAASGFPDEALDSARRAADLDPSDARALRHLGILEFKQGEVEAAVDHLRTALQLDTASSNGWYALGRALEASGDDESALEAFERCLAERADHHDCRHHRLRLLARTGRVDEALEVLEVLERSRPLSSSEHFLRGSLLLEDDRPEEARLSLERHREMSTEERIEREARRRYQARIEQTLMQVVNRDPSGALETIETLRSIDPGDDRLDILEADALVQLGRMSTGLETARRAARARPRFWRYRYLVALYLWKLGFVEPARTEVGIALRLQPLALPPLRLERQLVALDDPTDERLSELDRAIETLESLARPAEVGQGPEIEGEARELFWVELLLLHPESRGASSDIVPLD